MFGTAWSMGQDLIPVIGNDKNGISSQIRMSMGKLTVFWHAVFGTVSQTLLFLIIWWWTYLSVVRILPGLKWQLLSLFKKKLFWLWFKTMKYAILAFGSRMTKTAEKFVTPFHYQFSQVKNMQTVDNTIVRIRSRSEPVLSFTGSRESISCQPHQRWGNQLTFKIL